MSILLYTLCVVYIVDLQISLASFSPRTTIPHLNLYERYKDFFPLSKSNFQSSVIDGGQLLPWIIYFYSENVIPLVWKKTAVEHRGTFRFGMLNINEEKELAESLAISLKAVARVYPYGSRLKKLRSFKDVLSLKEAIAAAEASLPCQMVDLSKPNALERLVVNAMEARPTKFPAIIFTDGQQCEDIPALFKAIAVRFQRYFYFGQMGNTSDAALADLGLDAKQKHSVPGLLVIQVDHSTEPLSFSAVQFDTPGNKKPLNYPSLFAFLHSVNAKLRNYQISRSSNKGFSGSPRDVAATEILDAEKDLFDIKTQYFIDKDSSDYDEEEEDEDDGDTHFIRNDL